MHTIHYVPQTIFFFSEFLSYIILNTYTIEDTRSKTSTVYHTYIYRYKNRHREGEIEIERYMIIRNAQRIIFFYFPSGFLQQTERKPTLSIIIITKSHLPETDDLYIHTNI